MKTDIIYNEDCLTTMNRMANGSIDLVVTSPPYDGLRKYNGYAFDFETIAKQLFRVVKDGGIVVWIVGDQTNDGDESGTSFRQALYFKEIGFKLHDTMIYSKPAVPFDPKCNRYWQCFEYMFVFSRSGAKPLCNYLKEPCKMAGQAKKGDYGQKRFDGSNREDRRDSERVIQDDKVKSNIWFYTAGERVKGHPAQFPEKLAEDHILSWSNSGDIVYDPFSGSGTTAKMASANGRRFIGSEISEEYFDISISRLCDTF